MADTLSAVPMIKLYLATSSSSLFPHILLRHAGLSFTPIIVKITDLSKSEYLTQISAKAQVPVLQITSSNNTHQFITENPAIAYAIHRLSPASSLFGRTSSSQMAVMEWLSWIASSIHAQAWGPYLRPFRFTTSSNPEVLASIKEASKEKVLLQFGRLEDRLSEKQPWAVHGEGFTAVDAYVFMFYGLAKRLMDVDMAEMFPKWTKLVERLGEVEAVREAVDFDRRVEDGAEDGVKFFADLAKTP